MPMNVILLERVPKLGQMGDVVKVKPGYARNYLLPQKKALRATKDNITYFESQRKTLEAQNLERRQEAEAVAAKMSDLKVTLIRQASEALQLYGSFNKVPMPNMRLEPTEVAALIRYLAAETRPARSPPREAPSRERSPGVPLPRSAKEQVR